MRIIGILLLIVSLGTGCASVKFNPEGFEITKTPDGYVMTLDGCEVTLDKQQSEAEACLNPETD